MKRQDSLHQTELTTTTTSSSSLDGAGGGERAERGERGTSFSQGSQSHTAAAAPQSGGGGLPSGLTTTFGLGLTTFLGNSNYTADASSSLAANISGSALTSHSHSHSHRRSPSSPSIATSAASTSRRTPTHHVLQNLFASFVRAAEMKLNSLMFTHLDREVDLSIPLRPGYDLAFDRILVSMGSVSKHCPKLMIDSIMVWRKTKSESSSDKNVPGDLVLIAKMLGFPQPSTASASASTTTSGGGGASSGPVSGGFPQLKGKDMEAIIRERKSLASNYILCRVLLEIISRLTKATLPDELGDKLEDMVFGQLKNADP